MESYFPTVEVNTPVWNNIEALMQHTTHAYSSIKFEKEQVHAGDSKIKLLQETIKTLEEKLEHEKMERITTMNLDELILELEEELTQVIGTLIWFIKPVDNERNPKGIYSPKVGATEYNKVLGVIGYTYLYKSHKFVQKLKKEFKTLDMNNLATRVNIWKYIWKKTDFGKKISTELNTKRNTFLFNKLNSTTNIL